MFLEAKLFQIGKGLRVILDLPYLSLVPSPVYAVPLIRIRIKRQSLKFFLIYYLDVPIGESFPGDYGTFTNLIYYLSQRMG